VRLELVRQLADFYALPASDLLTGLQIPSSVPANGSPELLRDWKSIPAVVSAVVQMPELKALLAPLQFSAAKYGKAGEVEQWSYHFTSAGAMPPNTNVRSARMAAAGLAHAWNKNVMSADPSPCEEDVEGLRSEALKKIAGAAEPSMRAAFAIPTTGKAPGLTLLDALRESRLGLARD
jgi:hypothetical protein